MGHDLAIEPRFNISPGQDVVAVTTDRDGAPRPDVFRWGLVPYWADSPSTGYKMINARAETVADRPAFRDSFERRRCLVIADGFYEWQPRTHGPKQPWWITRADHEPFAFAGLWATWRAEPDDTPLRSCTIITTSANEALRDVHDRMPVILPPSAERLWLDHEAPSGEVRSLLLPLSAETTARVPVSTAVNDAGHDAPDCIQVIEVPPDEPREPSLF